MFYLRKNQLHDAKSTAIKMLEVHGFRVEDREDMVVGFYEIQIGHLIAMRGVVEVKKMDAEAWRDPVNFVAEILSKIKKEKKYLADCMKLVDVEELNQSNVDSVVKEINEVVKIP